MNLKTRVIPLVVLSIALSPHAQAQGRGHGKHEPIDAAGIARLIGDSAGEAQVSVHDATGAARFVRTAPGKKLGLQKQAARAATEEAKKGRAAEFFDSYGSIFGITNVASELKEVRVGKDRQGGTHITYQQVYHGMPVFAGELRSHFDAADELVAVNGTFVPEILVDPNPRRTAEEAGKTAMAKVEADLGQTGKLSVTGTTLLVFREGLAKGVPGPNHLAWQVEIGDGASVREFVFVDAHTGKFVDQITGIQDGLYRRAYDGANLPTPPPSYPNSPNWVEGDPFPTSITEADNMILSSKDTYDFYSKAFGRDSFDAAGGIMDSIFNRGYSCPNASWNGIFISFCPGLTTDDVTGHEWTHAYTQYTHNLIYQWQPGALNESYSDIFGETIDRINGRGGDTPNNPRTADSCSTFTPLPPTVKINAPAAIAGVKNAGTAAFGPQTFTLTNDVILVNDGVGTTNDGCETPFVNAAAIAGKIAFMDRGVCGFAVKALNAQLNGAVGVMIGNNQGGTAIVNMAGADPTVVIPSLSVTQDDGTAIKAQLASTTVNAKLSRGAVGTDNSVRWLLGEDDTAAGLTGALRDMWTPTCYNNPGKVTDTQYACGTADQGGVHNNSGVPNHGYALLVDGGTYNGQTVTGIGLTKAAHIYFRAMSVYQGPASDFADHADALDQSCSDLVGVNLADLTTGAPSGQVISSSDCAQVAKAALAVELRNPPTQCNFQPLLKQNPPPLCEAGGFATQLFHDNFDNGNSSTARWSVGHSGITADFTPRDWQVVSDLPDHRVGSAFFGSDPDIGTCGPGGDETAVLHLVSPQITIPASVSAPRLTFDHWVATETGWDGGNLKISVNGGPWALIQAADFVYNPYNQTLFTAGQGNSNPIAGQPAFSGTDGGAVGGSWGRSIVDLAPYAKPKDKIRLRFDLGNDGCGGIVGWYIDDLMVYKCH
jgi:Zn-dependent metalloprotease